MKFKLLTLFLFLFIAKTSMAQNAEFANTYTQKKEYGLIGNVREVKTYLQKIKKGKPLVDSIKAFSKYTINFDVMGNVLTINRNIKMDDGLIYTARSNFSSLGKNISYNEISKHNGQITDNADYKYVWLNEFSYHIKQIAHDDIAHTVTLNKDYRIIKTNFKIDNLINVSENFEYTLKNNIVERIKTVVNEQRGKVKTSSVQLQLIKEYDKYGNPTLIYSYDNLSEKYPLTIIFKQYKYY